jgi:hypothetical protein
MIRPMPRCFIAIAVLLTCGCVSAPGRARQSLGEGARVELVRTLSSPPLGGDGPPLVELRVTDGRGDEHLFGPVVGGVAWGDGALLLGADHALSLGMATGAETSIDRHVTLVPVISPDGRHFVYARSEDLTSFALVSRSEAGSAVLAEGLASIGALRFVTAERFVLVAGRSGGVAGLWIASTSSPARAACLTNCTLRTGVPWGDAFVPLPADLETLTLESDVLSYEDLDGAVHQVSVSGGAR